MRSTRRKPPTVLLVTADAKVRFRTREHLQAQGFSVFATGDARTALAWLMRHAADIVVADCLLPGTRMAIPHVLRRRGRPSCPKLIGIVNEPLSPNDELRSMLGFDELVAPTTPVVVLAKKLLELEI